MKPLLWVALIVGVAAVVEDLAFRRVSNWIPILALAGGLLFQTAESGWTGLGQASLGAVGGFLAFLVFYILGGMGGGDVKLMAGFGAVVGASRLLEACVLTALIGGVLAVLWLAAVTVRRRFKSAPSPERTPISIPYAPAITAGAWLTLLVRS